MTSATPNATVPGPARDCQIGQAVERSLRYLRAGLSR